MQVRDLLNEKAKMKAKDAWAHYEKVKQMSEKGQMTQKQVDGALATAKSLMDTEMKAREKSFLEKNAGADWWELAKKQYPIEEKGNGEYVVKSEAKQWKDGKDWTFDYKVQAMEKIEKLVKWLDQNRKRGFGDKEADLDKFHAKYGHKEIKESTDGEFAGFSPEHIRNLERSIGDLIDDDVDILSIRKRGKSFEASISYDGSKGKNNRGSVEFTAYPTNSGKIEDFRMTNLRGMNFVAKPDFNEGIKESKKEEGWYVEKNGKNVEGPMSESKARKRVKELGGDAKGYDVGYVSDFEVHRSKG